MVNTGQAGSAYTPNDSGVGRHFHTQLLYAVGYLKEHPNNPIRLEELSAFSRVYELEHNSELLAAFRAHEKVNYDEKLGLYSYKVRIMCLCLPEIKQNLYLCSIVIHLRFWLITYV